MVKRLRTDVLINQHVHVDDDYLPHPVITPTPPSPVAVLCLIRLWDEGSTHPVALPAFTRQTGQQCLLTSPLLPW